MKNKHITDKYLTYVIAQVIYHKIEPRIDALTELFFSNGRQLTVAMRKSFFALDLQYLEICKAGEKQSSRIGVYDNDWSPEYKRAGQLVSYWLHRLKDKTFTGDKYAHKLGKQAGLTVSEMERCILPNESKTHLKEAKEWFQCLKSDLGKLRVFFQEEQAETASQGNDKVKQRILKTIAASEKSKKSFRRIATALGKSRGGLTKLIVPDANGNEITLTDMEAIHDRLLKLNYDHYGQANETDFGAEGGSALLIDPDNPENIVDKLLAGTAQFDIRHLSPEAQEWLSCLPIHLRKVTEL